MQQSNMGGIPLMWSAENGHAEIVKVLINNGAALNVCDFYGSPPLMKAVYGGHVEAVQALVENKANVNIMYNGGITALYIAELKAQPEILRLLAEVSAIK
jgi:ankyrin repeat protein